MAGCRRRHEHLHLHWLAGVGLEFHPGVDVPQVRGFVFGQWNAEHEDLVGRSQHPQRHQHGDENFQMQSQ